jgi:pimeloyl-ACP methyl ester carboxylesterase
MSLAKQSSGLTSRIDPPIRSEAGSQGDSAMRVLVNGVRLFFDVEGTKLVPNGPAMRERPTLLLLHGGPGFDHSIYRPAYSALADVAQIIYLDHRGNGRSEDGPQAGWNLAQWGDDVHAFCWASRAQSSSAGHLAAWWRWLTRRAIRPTPPSWC